MPAWKARQGASPRGSWPGRRPGHACGLQNEKKVLLDNPYNSYIEEGMGGKTTTSLPTYLQKGKAFGILLFPLL